MSVNWDIRDLLRVLKTRRIALRCVRVGDILAGDFYPDSIASIEVDPTNGEITLLDGYGGGTVYPDPESLVTIIDRRALDKDRVAEQIEHDERAGK